ncbi:MAG: PTS sugar transporter subunit IIC [Endomicrobia bacterium]|nr:PTS sugar transporter subunit IIC [Endomicrobiia bacterium]MCL2507240.1 PTS sugar transporter subunit IIC [Endomicrobiia bacterium]
MIIENIFVLAFIAAWCSADVTAFGQFMIYRPIFCAPLIGFLTGDVTSGLWLGMIAEMVWINAVPLGVAVPIDISLISMLSTFWVNKYFPGIQEAAIWSLVFAIPFAYLYKEIDIAGRKFNIKIMHWVERGVQKDKESRINLGIFFGLFLFVLRLYIFYLIAMGFIGILYQMIYLQFPAFMVAGFKKAWFLLPVLGFGAILHNFRNIKVPFLESRKKC